MPANPTTAENIVLYAECDRLLTVASNLRVGDIFWPSQWENVFWTVSRLLIPPSPDRVRLMTTLTYPNCPRNREHGINPTRRPFARRMDFRMPEMVTILGYDRSLLDPRIQAAGAERPYLTLDF